jgi:hypothetical protein
LGADDARGEAPTYMNDLDALVKNKEREIQNYQKEYELSGRSRQMGVGKGPQSHPFAGDMNEFAKIYRTGGAQLQPPQSM